MKYADEFNYAVIGHPIAHSLSPVMQNAGLKALGLKPTYGAIDVDPAEMAEFAEWARGHLRGFNATVPHKHAIVPFLDWIDPAAELGGRVNTVKVEDCGLRGFSTDGYGLAKGLEEDLGVEVAGSSFLFLGCGGAVRAVAAYFAGLAPSKLMFANRTLPKAESLAAEIADATGVACAACSPDDRRRLTEFHAAATVVIQGTSLGLRESDPSPLPLELFNSDTKYYDTIYHPTAFGRAAGAAGADFADGRSMLLHQGARALSIWTEMEAPVEIMREALRRSFEL